MLSTRPTCLILCSFHVSLNSQGRGNDKASKEKERRELRELVGRNLVVLSQLDGVTLEIYKSTVLPRVLEQIVNCKDEIAQFYLMDAVIQVRHPVDLSLSLNSDRHMMTVLSCGLRYFPCSEFW